MNVFASLSQEESRRFSLSFEIWIPIETNCVVKIDDKCFAFRKFPLAFDKVLSKSCPIDFRVGFRRHDCVTLMMPCFHQILISALKELGSFFILDDRRVNYKAAS